MDLNYLIGLEHEYGADPTSGKTDCWLLAAHILSRHGMEVPDYRWVFCQYREDELSYEAVREWVLEVADPVEEPHHLDFFMRASPPLVAFGTVVHDHVYFIGPGGRVICKELAKIKRLGSFYRMKSGSAMS